MRPPTYTPADANWVRSQKGSAAAIHRLAQTQRKTNLSEGIIKRIRSAGQKESNKPAPAGRESTEPEIAPPTSVPPVLDPRLTTGPTSLGKRKRLNNKCDNDDPGAQTLSSDSEPDIVWAAAEREQQHKARSRLQGDWLNDSNVNDLVRLFDGVDVKVYSSYDFITKRQIKISKEARVNVFPLNIGKHWVGVAVDGTGRCKFFDSLKSHTQQIKEAMKRLQSHVTDIQLNPPEEVDCAKQLNGLDCGVHTVVNLIYEILDIPLPRYIDGVLWRHILLWIWDRQYQSELLHQFPANKVHCEDHELFSKGALLQCPKASTLLKKKLTADMETACQGLHDWSTSCKRNKEAVTRFKKYERMQTKSHAEVESKSDELEELENAIQAIEALGSNQDLFSTERARDKVNGLREDIKSAQDTIRERDENIRRQHDEMSKHKEEWTDLRTEAQRHLLTFDETLESILELSQIEDTPLATCNSLTSAHSIQLTPVVKALRTAQRIVVLVGAGISTSAGIPDFRSSQGLYKTQQKKHNLKGSGQDLFDCTVYLTADKTAAFHKMVHDLSILAQKAQPTAFHSMLGILAQEKRLLCLMSQNIDDLDTSIPSLATKVPLTPPYPITLQLHGSIGKMTCISCYRIAKLDPGLFSGPSMSPCEDCVNQENGRSRAAKVGGMRPRMTLYGERGADEDALTEAINLVMKKTYDVCIVAGTSLTGITSVQDIVRNFRRCAEKMVWINLELPPKIKGVTWDHIFKGYCDDVARGVMKD